jgi:hypothetical protein
MKWLNSYRKEVILVGFVSAIVLSGGVAKADFTFGEPTNLGPPMSTSADELGPWVSADGLSLYFTSDRPGGHGGDDIWVATRATKTDKWSNPMNFSTIVNGSFDESCARISTDRLSLYFSSNRTGGYGGSDIWVTTRETEYDDWGIPVNLGPKVNSSAHEITPSLSSDGLELYFSGFVSPFRPGGQGNADLWVTTRPTKNDPWDNPVNLGPVVNSSSQDTRPYLSADGLLLFFDSQRPGGYGYGDLYMTRRATLSDPWGPPVNLGPTVNRSGFEELASISVDGSVLFFDYATSSNWNDGDIWHVPIISISDFNGDGIIDATDMCIMVDHWGENYSLCDIGPTPFGDGIVDVQDLIVLAEHLFEEVGDPTLVAHWALDEAEGDIAQDIANDNDGTVYGNPAWQPEDGIVDGALQLDGIDDYVSTPFVLNPSDGKFSVVAWVKGGAPGQVVLSQQGAANWLTADNEGNLMTELKGTGRGSAILPSQAVITDGTWHRIGFVWDGSHRTLYVDDLAVAEDTQENLDVSENRLYLGTGKAMEPGSFWSGLIDDVRIYNRAVRP